MRHLLFTNYESGRSGLSNGIMSIECGVALAFLTNRFLVLDGNISPPANVVSYGGRVSNENPSKITDLIDLPVAWAEPSEVDLRDVPSRELTDEHLGQLVLYFPGTLDLDTDDARAFARDRTVWVHPGGELDEVPLLRVTEDAVVLREGRKRTNLNFYSYLYYLDDETRRSLYRVLERMQPKPELAELASRVAADLGKFNAVHLRRGDFKMTYGVTTLDRQPWEAIEAMDHHFSRSDTLVILTDERDDPFFDEIKAAYPHHVFIDHHILDEYGDRFDQLPTRDSLALAHLSQQIGAESEDFIGTMTSTFTAMIQRYRGSRGREEPFKFFWNELPEPSFRTERGRHPISECVPLHESVMVEEYEGPYSWNRYNQRIAPSWMREWPESFLTEEVLATGALPGKETAPELVSGIEDTAGGKTRVAIPFGRLRIGVETDSRRLGVRIAETFGARREPNPPAVIARLAVSSDDGVLTMSREGEAVRQAPNEPELLRELKLEIGRILCFARPTHLWLEGAVLSRDGWGIALAGHLGEQDDSVIAEMCSADWDLFVDDLVPVLPEERRALPFGRTLWPKGASVRARREPTPLRALILCARRLHHRNELSLLSPAVAVAESLAHSLDFREDRDRAVKRLCRLAEEVPVFQLSYSSAERAARLLDSIEEALAALEARRAPAPTDTPGGEEPEASEPSGSRQLEPEVQTTETPDEEAEPTAERVQETTA